MWVCWQSSCTTDKMIKLKKIKNSDDYRRRVFIIKCIILIPVQE